MEEENKLNVELERTKEDLEDLETYVEEFSAFLPLAVCTVNPLGVIINVNSAFENVTGYSALEGVGKKTADLFRETEAVNIFLEGLKQGDVFAKSTEVTLARKDGTEWTVNLTASTRTGRNGEHLGFFLGINDVTELKTLQNKLEDQVEERTKKLNARTEELEESQKEILKALEAVEREREKTLSVLSNLTDGLVFMNTDGVVELINPHAEAILKVKADEVIGRKLEPKDSSAVDMILSLVSGSTSTIEREPLTLGEELYVEVSVVPVVADDMELGSLIVVHDVSQEHALENLKVEFISVAAHQMRTPLAAINWAFELILSADEGEVSSKLKPVAKNGFESAQRILRIVNHFLDVSQVESANQNYTFASVDIKKVVQDIFSGVSMQAEERGISLVFAPEESSLPPINADQGKLDMVMQNLIENALKYTIQKGTITVDAVPQESELLISVKDEGIGIPASEAEHLFTRFYRASNARKVETDGNGLGLYMVKRIIERHGGKIWFESTEGVGTTFYFTVPLLTQKTNHGNTGS